MKNTEIALNNYKDLLVKIRNCIKQTGEKIAQNSIREKVVMSWQIGKLISGNLSKNTRADYGEKLFAALEKDLLIKRRALYKMKNFYQSYPTLPENNPSLNWSHYRVLAEIKNDEKRKYFESLTVENSWTTDDLQTEVAKSKTKKRPIKKKSVTKKLRPERGKLFSYPLIKLENADATCIDCGFNFFREAENQPKNLQNVDVIKKGEIYSLKKSTVHPRKFNTYKAYLDRVVDGDTIRVTIDLGFKTFHNEIIRLKGISAAEIDTESGKKITRALAGILEKTSFLIIKTVRIDIYGRYVADVFFSDKNETNAQKVADEGIYLNQLLLDRGLVEIWEG